MSRTHPLFILVIAGANLSLAQFAAMKEFAALVGSNELVAFLVAAGYFLGLSAGYLVSDRLSQRTLLVLGGLTLALHSSLPFSARWLAGTMAGINLAGNIPPFVFLLTMCGTAPFYASLLPRLVAESNAREDALIRYYATEIGGGLLGLVIVLIATPARMPLILALHLAGLAALFLLFTGGRPRWALGLLALPGIYLAWWPALDRASLNYYYQNVRHYHSPALLASEFSPYQRVDLVAAGVPSHRATYLYLNGNLLYGSRSLHRHNLLVSILPNLMAGPGPALVVAGGSLDNARYLAPRTEKLYVVELDETVVRLTRKHLQEPRGGFPDNWHLAIDDGKHFLGNWQGPPFGVIAVDVPIPSHLQTAMLHSERFFKLAASRLEANGIFSISLAGRLQDRSRDDPPSQRLANRILAGLLNNFRQVTVVRTGGHDFAWASNRPLPWSSAELQARMDDFINELSGGRESFGSPRLSVLDRNRVLQAADGVKPIGEADMQVVLNLSWSKLYHRFYEPK